MFRISAAYPGNAVALGVSVHDAMLTVTVSGHQLLVFEIPFLFLIKHLAVIRFGIRTAVPSRAAHHRPF